MGSDKVLIESIIKQLVECRYITLEEAWKMREFLKKE